MRHFSLFGPQKNEAGRTFCVGFERNDLLRSLINYKRSRPVLGIFPSLRLFSSFYFILFLFLSFDSFSSERKVLTIRSFSIILFYMREDTICLYAMLKCPTSPSTRARYFLSTVTRRIGLSISCELSLFANTKRNHYTHVL